MSDTPTPRWTQEEIDDIKQRAAERMRRFGLAPSAPPASSRLKMADIRVGMRLRDPDDYRFTQEGVLTVTEITDAGFRYDAERDVSLGARHGVMLAKGRQHFGMNGDCLYVPYEFPLPASARTVPTPPCIGCGGTKLVGYTLDRRPGPFCRDCWGALKLHVAQVNLLNIKADAREVEPEPARPVTRYTGTIEIPPETASQPPTVLGAEVVLYAEVASLLTALAEVEKNNAALRTSRDEYQALASVGTWHRDCRPNRKKAAEEIQKSQQRIDALATALAEREAEIVRLREAVHVAQSFLQQLTEAAKGQAGATAEAALRAATEHRA